MKTNDIDYNNPCEVAQAIEENLKDRSQERWVVQQGVNMQTEFLVITSPWTYGPGHMRDPHRAFLRRLLRLETVPKDGVQIMPDQWPEYVQRSSNAPRIVWADLF